jgi:hypothetical protein
MIVRLARKTAAVAAALGLALSAVACGQTGGEGVPGAPGSQGTPRPAGQVSLEFEEQERLDERGWTVAGPADKWVLAAVDDGQLSEALADTAVWHNGPLEAEDAVEAPAIPEGQTALLYFAGDRPGSAVVDSTVGIYESDGEWSVFVERVESASGGTDAIISERHLVFVDAPAPRSVRLRFEDTSTDPPEVTWW